MGMNNIAGNIWDDILKKAKYISKNATVDNIEKSWNTYMIPSSKELSNIARESMQRKNTVLSNLNMNDVNNAYNNMANKSPDYIKEFNKLKSAIDSGNVDEAKNVANNISSRFQDDSYVKFLSDANDSYVLRKEAIEKVRPRRIEEMAQNELKQKIKNKKIANTFLNDKQQGKLAKNIYNTQGYMPLNYFNSGNVKTNQVRMGVTAGGYMAVGTATRLLNGGGLFENEYGERDIVGIPFI